MSETAGEVGRFRSGFLVGIVLLVIQFLLGMAVNLFVTVPKEHPGSNPQEYFSGVAQSVTWAILHGPPLLVLHAIVGLALAITGFGVVYRAVKLRRRGIIWASSTGAVAILGAGLNGGSFLNYHEDFSSMLMASFFAIAVIAYAAGLYVSGTEST
ncbi:MAG TPA: hypothetical protein VGG90_05825 [Candidatus Dormibacteraeota bacterium]